MDMFTVLSEPNRRHILDVLRDEPCTVTHLVHAIGMQQPVVSKHLRILREAGLVAVRPDGQRRWYEINPEPFASLDAWLEPYRRLWSKRLDALERHLDSEE